MKLSNIGLALALTLLNIQESDCLSKDRIPTFDECANDADVVVQETDGGIRIKVKGKEQDVIFRELRISKEVESIKDKYDSQKKLLQEQIDLLDVAFGKSLNEQLNLWNLMNPWQDEQERYRGLSQGLKANF